MIINALSSQPLNRLGTMTLIPPGTKNDLNSRSVEDVAQADHGMNSFILGHSLIERLPILGLFLYMMNTFGDICKGAVDVENDKLISHKSLLKYSC
jgi:hypothetical protein